MDKNDKAPLRACVFNDLSIVEFAENTEEKNSFKITAYSGEVIPNHWYWGNLAFDLEGIKFAKKKTPILQEHFRSDRIGFSTKQEIADKVTLEGKFLSNEKAVALKSDISEGFPMQASVYLPPESVEFVKPGATAKVNGKTMTGPGAIFRKGKILEVSMCTLGVDSNTMSETFAEGGKSEIKFNVSKGDQEMAQEKTEMTPETFAAENPELFALITAAAKAEGVKSEVERFGKFAEQFKDDPEFCIKQFQKAETSLSDAVAAYAEKLKADKTKLAEDLADEKAKNAQAKVDPASTEFSDGAATGDEVAAGESEKDAWTKEFKASKNLQAEFGAGDRGLESYLAYKKADDEGRVR